VHRLGLPTPAYSPSAGRPAASAAGDPHDPGSSSGPPVLIVAGWFDCFLQGSLDSYAQARQAGTPATLIVGPWSHDNQTGRIGDTDFGAIADAANIDAAESLLSRELDWFDRHLKPGSEANGSRCAPPASAPPVLVFVMGSNQWRRFPAWPPESDEVPWYLHSDGRLSHDAPGADSPPGVFRHDPSNPVPTYGGAILVAPGSPAGPLDQRQVERREDVLVYTSRPLTAPLEVVGRVKAHLVTDSTAPTTDWVARLCDVDVDGVSRNIADGILRTRHDGVGSAQRPGGAPDRPVVHRSRVPARAPHPPADRLKLLSTVGPQSRGSAGGLWR
jgi:putative CocE/NonD family hydrolase